MPGSTTPLVASIQQTAIPFSYAYDSRGNIVSENITLKHYMNTTWVARPILEDLPSDRVLFGDFYVEGMETEKK